MLQSVLNVSLKRCGRLKKRRWGQRRQKIETCTGWEQMFALVSPSRQLKLSRLPYSNCNIMESVGLEPTLGKFSYLTGCKKCFGVMSSHGGKHWSCCQAAATLWFTHWRCSTLKVHPLTHMVFTWMMNLVILLSTSIVCVPVKTSVHLQTQCRGKVKKNVFGHFRGEDLLIGVVFSDQWNIIYHIYIL